jgi:hypothetical protein
MNKNLAIIAIVIAVLFLLYFAFDMLNSDSPPIGPTWRCISNNPDTLKSRKLYESIENISVKLPPENLFPFGNINVKWGNLKTSLTKIAGGITSLQEYTTDDIPFDGMSPPQPQPLIITFIPHDPHISLQPIFCEDYARNRIPISVVGQ